MIQSQSSNSEADSFVTINLEESSEENVSSDGQSTLVPNSSELGGFQINVMRELSDQSTSPSPAPVTAHSIAETSSPSLDKAADEGLMLLKYPRLGGFDIHVTRELADQSTSPQPASPAPVTAHSVAETSSPSLDKAADEGLMLVKSPRANETQPCTRGRSRAGTDDVEIAPPRIRLVDEDNEDPGGIVTQQSQVISESWLGPYPVPQFEGPTMHQQLNMGSSTSIYAPVPQSRVQFMGPAPSQYGHVHFSTGSHLSIQPEPVRRVFVDGGLKYLSLSNQTSDGDKKGKKKVEK